MATSSTYCTHRDVKDVFPDMDSFDTKTPIYGWEFWADTFGSGADDDDFDFYYTHNTGLVTQLFFDGAKCVSLSATQVALINESFASNDNILTVDAGHGLAAGDIIKVGNEYLGIIGVSTNDLTVFRGGFGTSAADIADDTPVYLILDNSTLHDGRGLASDESPYYYYYDSALDFVMLVVDGEATNGANPADHLLESGEDYTTLVARIMKNASRFLDARLDANLPRDQFKDKEGNFDYMIVRTASLLSAKFLIKAQEPTNPMADEFEEEIKENIEALNTGKTRLSGNVTGDASKGIVREVVAPQASNGLHIVDTRGHYSGIYDLIKVVINTAGVIGTAKFDVYGKSSDNLKDTQIVTALTINGQYQSIGNGLEIRFSGKNSSSAATLGVTPDEWEIEAWGRMESMDDNIGNVRSVKMTRGGLRVR